MFQPLKAFSAFGSFSSVCRPFFFSSWRGTWSKITSRCLRSLIGQLSLLLVPNMVLSKMNNHEHRTEQTYESYTFQPLMSYCIYLTRAVLWTRFSFSFLAVITDKLKKYCFFFVRSKSKCYKNCMFYAHLMNMHLFLPHIYLLSLGLIAWRQLRSSLAAKFCTQLWSYCQR